MAFLGANISWLKRNFVMILLLGRDGQVGWELQRSLSCVGTLVSLGRKDVDLERTDELRDCIRRYSPKIIVNAAAYTAVDKAESEPDKAKRANYEAVGVMAEETSRLDAWLVHFSTDYVFDGTKEGRYTEQDAPNPLSTYGRTKLAGEDAIRRSNCKHLIFRSSWVYSVYGSNFPLAILKRAKERDQLEVISDSFGAPTSAHLIADVTAMVLHRLIHEGLGESDCSGTYHLSAGGETSWYEYAKYVISLARKRGMALKAVPNRVFPVSTDHYQAPALRPKNSRLSTNEIGTRFDIVVPDWKVHVERFVDELCKAKQL